MSKLIQKLLKNNKNPKLIEEAFEYAQKSYADVQWLSGENYMEHAVRTALILKDMGIDQKTIAASLLYNVANTKNPQDQKKKLQEIEKKFGRDIAVLAERGSELNKVYYSIAIDVKAKKVSAEEKIENIRKMFFAIARDVRVILIKLAARIDGMNTITRLPEEMQKIYATETQKIFVPIANRLGLGDIRTRLEDLAFEHLEPDRFRWLQEHVKEKYEERQRYLKKFIPYFKRFLKHEKIKFIDINYRAKSYWSTYQKLQRYDMDFERIYDLVALRLIVKDVATCYRALGLIHKFYQPMSGQIQDYIAKPKENSYQSLHTTVLLAKNRISEIQIKTEEMHREAQYGICAHWAYKEQIDLEKEKDKISWTKSIPEFWKSFKIDFFENQVFAFTPKGDVIVLPKGSTPIDFAYAVHSDIGNHCEAAKIGGKIVPLAETLKNGDVVEIITSKTKKPSQDWLRFVKTGFARSHIKKFALSIPSSILSIPSFITKKIFEISERAKKKKQEGEKVTQENPPQVYLAGQKGIMVNIAKCCVPKTGDTARAYLTKHRAAVLHKVSCKNLQMLAKSFPEKIVEASWQ